MEDAISGGLILHLLYQTGVASVFFIDQRHHKRRKNPHSTGRLEPVRGSLRFLNGCDNLGGGSVDAFYEPYINGEKELREINEEYRSNSVRSPVISSVI